MTSGQRTPIRVIDSDIHNNGQEWLFDLLVGASVDVRNMIIMLIWSLAAPK
jgi:hypothetical protein